MKKGNIIGVFLLIVLIFFIIFCLTFFLNRVYYCNDGTVYDDCSNIKPYLCTNGVLIEKASICGCSPLLDINGEECLSKYQQEPKNAAFRYVLRGEKKYINFVVYKNMSDYVSKLPRYINADENPTLLDFKLRLLDEEQQRELLLPLVIAIQNQTADREDQARIAISLVQSIPFGNSNKTLRLNGNKVEYQRYPYEVLYDQQGICSEKVALLIFLLREIGYGAASIYYPFENHEAVGIRCPKDKGVNNTEYCFIETTGPSIITDDRTEYFGGRQLNSTPQIIVIQSGMALGKGIYEYSDAKLLISIREEMKTYGTINPLQDVQFKNLKKKYGLVNPDEYVF